MQQQATPMSWQTSKFKNSLDGNHLEITNALRLAGATVQDLSGVGNGCPDIIVGFNNKNHLLEIKMPTGKLNKRQQRWHKKWSGGVQVVSSSEDAFNACGIPLELLIVV